MLVSVPLTDVPLPGIAPTIAPDRTGIVQVYVVPEGTTPSVRLAGVIVNVLPLQIVEAWLFIAGIGLTVTVTVNVAPVQLPEIGVTVYVA